MIKSLKITNWKAFENKQITFEEGITFFVGPNGSGKTTLLEAICLAVTGKSLTADFQELVRLPEFPSEVQLEFEIEGKNVLIRRRFRRDRKLSAEIILNNHSRATGWDDVTSATLGLFSVDEMFFNRLTYMSEGEVFKYLQDPPSEALNSRIQEIFGIANLQTLKGFAEEIKKDRSSLIREISSELKTITIEKPIEESQITALENFISQQKEKEKGIYEKRDSLSKEIRNLEEEGEIYENLKRLLDEISQYVKEEIAGFAEASFDKILPACIKSLETRILSEETNLGKTEILAGAVQNRSAYLRDIENLLQSVIVGTKDRTDVPCPLCKRPIDKALADRLIQETANQIRATEKELSETQKTASDLRTKINELRGKIQKLRDYETRLKIIPASVMEKAKPLILDKIDQQMASIIASLETKTDELKMITSSHEALRKEIESKTQELANMKAEIRQGDRLKLLKERLCTTYEAEMLAEIINGTLDLTLHEQKDRGLTGLYGWISHFWNKFRPESKWEIMLDENGIVRVGSKERQYDFAHLSGGEKTVLLVLVRVMFCRFLATNIDFIMIDEPLEHLDIRNRRSLLNFLVGACRKNIIPQMLITTFEETLIRKYYEGEKTRTELLA